MESNRVKFSLNSLIIIPERINKNNFYLDKFDQFWSVNKKLMEISDGEGFKSIPFRVYQV